MSQIQTVKVNYVYAYVCTTTKCFKIFSCNRFYLMYCTSNGPIAYFRCFPIRLNKLQQAIYA